MLVKCMNQSYRAELRSKESVNYLERERSWGGDKMAVFGRLKAQPVAEGEPSEDTVWKRLRSRFLFVTYQQRNSLILKAKGKGKQSHLFIYLFGGLIFSKVFL